VIYFESAIYDLGFPIALLHLKNIGTAVMGYINRKPLPATTECNKIEFQVSH
jgi:hypothetical protein